MIEPCVPVDNAYTVKKLHLRSGMQICRRDTLEIYEVHDTEPYV